MMPWHLPTPLLLLCLSLASATQQPNIVFLLSDDQDLLLGSLNFMPSTQKLLIQQGTTLANHFTSTPVCCPSRSSIITGRFPHNYPQIHPTQKTSCLDPTHDNDKLSVFESLHNAGYRVGLFGKHMNAGGMGPFCPKDKHSQGRMPAGIDKYLGMCPDTCYQDCVFAKGEKYGGQTDWVKPKDHAGYHTSIIGNRTLQFVRDTANAGVPFFVHVSPHAPHLPCTPAPWYVDTPIKGRAPRNLAWNKSSPDKHWMVSEQPPLTESDAQELDGIFVNRSRTLLSVDDIVHDVVSLLKELDIDNNTFVVYTSDHGFHLGSYRLGAAKRQIYDTDLRVPLLVRGPHIAQNATVSILSSHVDLAPTFLDMAGISSDPTMDGRSLLPSLLQGLNSSREVDHQVEDVHNQKKVKPEWRTQIYVEYQGVGTVGRDVLGRVQRGPNNTFIGIRRQKFHMDVLYSEFDDSNQDFSFETPGFVEAYDFRMDPSQLVNVAGSEKPSVVEEWRESLHQMLNCSGSAEGVVGSCFV